MKTIDFDFFDSGRSRHIPVVIYLPEGNIQNLSVVIFNPGLQSQEELGKADVKPGHKNYNYLANYFVNQNYAFVAIQHDMLGDKDGLETIDPNAIQHEARRHLYVRGVANINFVLNELEKLKLSLKLDKFIIGGHSNGGDIAKYFVNLHPNKISQIIVFDARRCRLEPTSPVKLLMFEADDSSTDLGVLPEPEKVASSKRSNLEWVIIKPYETLHVSYLDDYITDSIKNKITKALDWFLWDN